MPTRPSPAARRAPLVSIALTVGVAAVAVALASAQAPPAPASAAKPPVPDWAHPATATRAQVAPPPDFRRPTTLIPTPIGIFEGQAEVGTPIAPGSARFDPATGRYTITASDYNVWYYRDEFRFLWKQVSGDVSLAADVAYPDPKGYGDRKAVLVIRQDLDDDSVQVVVAPHGAGMIQLAQRATKGARVTDLEYLPDMLDTAVLSNVVLENAAGRIR